MKGDVIYNTIQELKGIHLLIIIFSLFMLFVGVFHEQELEEQFLGTYISRTELPQIVSNISNQFNSSQRDIRNLNFIVIEGMSGVGKTSLGREAANIVMANAKIPIFRTTIRLHAIKSSDSPKYGLEFLKRSFCEIHLFPDFYKGQSLTTLLKKWHNSSEKAGWILHIDEFQLSPTTTRAILRAVRDWNISRGKLI